VVANEHPEQTQILADSGMGPTVPWDEAAFADAVVALLADPEAARARAALGPDWVRAHRTYGVIAAQVDAVYRDLLSTSAQI
jgi:glycosyltransferase involved in cell wall biosynthesis